MQKLPYLLMAFLTLFLAESCSTGEKKAEDRPAPADTSSITTKSAANATESSSGRPFYYLNKNCIGSYNLIVTTEMGEDMVEKFDAAYVKAKGGERLETSFWIDKYVIDMFTAHLAKSDYDGVNFINTAGTAGKSTLLLVPTRPGAGPGKHVNSWDFVSHPNSTQYEFKGFNWGQQKSETAKNNFKPIINIFKNLPLLTLSESVWFSECLFSTLSELLEKSNFSGIRVYAAAYLRNMNDSAIGQKKDNQSTFIIVPTFEESGQHRDDWTIVKPDKNTVESWDAYNHGQLCPQICF